MPIYMDRHDLPSAVTAEHVAHIHQEDLKIQDRYGCRGLTYWFDDVRKVAFCLVEAPDQQSLREMHRVAHGDVPHTVIEVNPVIVDSFLGRIEDPANAQDTALNIINDPAFRTIMVIKLQNLLDQPNDCVDIALHKPSQAVPGILSSYAGNLVKGGEYHFLVSFNSVSNAVHAAMDIHAVFEKYAGDCGKAGITLKTGLSAGVPVTGDKQLFEDTIKSAERSCAVVNGGIIVSAEVKDLYNAENIKQLVEDETIIALTPSDELFVKNLMDFTEITWDQINLKVDDFCKPVGCSQSQFYRRMIALIGKSPNTFLKEYRLDRALKLLTKKAGNIADIAFETGFGSPSYFSKCFQKRYHHCPSDYLSTKAG